MKILAGLFGKGIFNAIKNVSPGLASLFGSKTADDIDHQNALNARYSWKDEYLLILFTVPIILYYVDRLWVACWTELTLGQAAEQMIDKMVYLLDDDSMYGTILMMMVSMSFAVRVTPKIIGQITKRRKKTD